MGQRVLLKEYVFWGLATHCLKPNEHVRLVERNICFISDAGNRRGGRGEGGRHLSKSQLPRPPPPMTQQAGDVSFHRQRVCVGALRAETAESSLPVLFRWAMGGLSSVILVVLGAVNLQFRLFPFL